MKSENDIYEQNATALFRSGDTAILSTIDRNDEHYPFGSFVTFVSSVNRELFLYTSTIAEHTKNFVNDSRACVTIFNVVDKDDKQNSARLSLIGNITKVGDTRLQGCQSRFFAFLPESEKYSRIHGFNFYKFETVKARWIGGFGQIGWLDTQHWIADEPQWINNQQAMIDHMNEDHANVVRSTLHAKCGVKDINAKMIALCTDGYYTLSQGKRYYIGFDRPCYTEKALREMLIEHANNFRKFDFS